MRAAWSASDGMWLRDGLKAPPRREVTSGEHHIFQILTAVTTVVQRSFGKLPRRVPPSYNHGTLVVGFSFRLRVGRRGEVVSAL